eukprot:5223594-Alexandrium_andersonii.AAC.1
MVDVTADPRVASGLVLLAEEGRRLVPATGGQTAQQVGVAHLQVEVASNDRRGAPTSRVGKCR